MSTVASVVLWLSLAGVVAFLAFSKKGRGIGKRFHSLVQPYEDTQAADAPAGGRSPRGKIPQRQARRQVRHERRARGALIP